MKLSTNFEKCLRQTSVICQKINFQILFRQSFKISTFIQLFPLFNLFFQLIPLVHAFSFNQPTKKLNKRAIIQPIFRSSPLQFSRQTDKILNKLIIPMIFQSPWRLWRVSPAQTVIRPFYTYFFRSDTDKRQTGEKNHVESRNRNE